MSNKHIANNQQPRAGGDRPPNAGRRIRVAGEPDLTLATLLENRRRCSHPLISWLGQAGFLLAWDTQRWLIDPYLSDSLAEKYRGTRFPHTRMAPSPVAAGQMKHVDIVLCTHAHTDHMDPDTLSVIATRNPDCRFLVPAAVAGIALDRGVPADRLIAARAMHQLELGSEVTVCPIPSAHEDLQVDEAGHHLFLGYLLQLPHLTLYHSGDCIPYSDLPTTLAGSCVDVALLPINGRDSLRREHGIPGNFTFAEAAELCTRAGIAAMIPCHFGMFEFNTVDPHWLDQQIAGIATSLACLRIEPGQVYRLETDATELSLPAALSQRNLP